MPREKKLRVGIMGFPIGKHVSLRFRGNGFNSRVQENFNAGQTNLARKQMANSLKKMSSQLEEQGVKLVVDDLGERWRTREDGMKARKKFLKNVGQRLNELHKKYDLLVFVGGRHTTAYSVYHIPGKVLRIDEHHDAAPASVNVHYGNYVRHAVKDRVKKVEDISNILMNKTHQKSELLLGDLLNPNAKKTLKKVRGLEIFDIDLDAFDKAYLVEQQFNPNFKGNNVLDPEDWVTGVEGLGAKPFRQILLSSVPHTLAFHEYYGGDRAAKKARVFMNAVTRWAVRAKAAEKLKKK